MLGWLGEARAEGEAEGEAKAGAKFVLRLLERRGLTPTPEQQALIVGCTDDAKITAWFDRACTARTVDAVLAPESN